MNKKIEEATISMLQELKEEILKADTQEMHFSRVSELLEVVSQPVRFLANRESSQKIRR